MSPSKDRITFKILLIEVKHDVTKEQQDRYKFFLSVLNKSRRENVFQNLTGAAQYGLFSFLFALEIRRHPFSTSSKCKN